jgi:hypothetical protein
MVRSIQKRQEKSIVEINFQPSHIWQDRFINTAPIGWPESEENFKGWSQPEKEAVLRAISFQPRVLRELFAKITRGVISNSPKNPGSTVMKLDTIALYDEFFKSSNQDRILAHELSHLYLHGLDQTKLADLVEELGWQSITEVA